MRICLAIICSVVSLCAADGGATITPAPGFEPVVPTAPPQPQGPLQRPTQPQMLPSRPTMAFEVELVVLKSGDTAALGQWAELAALGYHVVATVPGDGQVSLYLERSLAGAAPTAIRLPAAIAGDAATSLKARIEAAMAERLRAAAPQRPVQPVGEKK